MQNFNVCVQMCVFRGFMAPNRLESSGKNVVVFVHIKYFFGGSIYPYRSTGITGLLTQVML